MTFIDPAPYAAAAETLRIKLTSGSVALGPDDYQTAILDMGPASVEGWLSEIIAAELGLPLQGVLDPAKRALSVRGRSVPLTRREFEVLAYLVAREGTAVSRDELIVKVWGLKFDAGSNVVDAVIASLRRKLEDLAPAIETIRGYGYAYRPVSEL
jgi:Transcriptional regulatory protein, C terminal